MSDHVDGPRSIGDPPADVTDLFAFTSPENPARTVLAMCVFPSAGEDAVFSNAIDYSIAVRRVVVAGVGAAAKFQPGDDEIRFSFRFEALKRDNAGKALQRAVGTPPAAPSDRAAGSRDAGGRDPGVRRAAFGPVLPRLGRRQAREASEPATARQRAVHGRRARYPPRARSRDGLVVWRHRRDGSHPTAAQPPRISRPPRRLGRTPRGGWAAVGW